MCVCGCYFVEPPDRRESKPNEPLLSSGRHQLSLPFVFLNLPELTILTQDLSCMHDGDDDELKFTDMKGSVAKLARVWP